jgi:hypothetical protein
VLAKRSPTTRPDRNGTAVFVGRADNAIAEAKCATLVPVRAGLKRGCLPRLRSFVSFALVVAIPGSPGQGQESFPPSPAPALVDGEHLHSRNVGRSPAVAHAGSVRFARLPAAWREQADKCRAPRRSGLETATSFCRGFSASCIQSSADTTKTPPPPLRFR